MLVIRISADTNNMEIWIPRPTQWLNVPKAFKYLTHAHGNGELLHKIQAPQLSDGVAESRWPQQGILPEIVPATPKTAFT